MERETRDLNFSHGREEQESNLHLLQDAGFLARKAESPAVKESVIRSTAQQYLLNAGYIEEIPSLDGSTPLSPDGRSENQAWIKARSEEDGRLDCAGEVKGFGIKFFGTTLFGNLKFKESRLCEARQMVDATCEMVDVKGRRLSSATTSGERDEAARELVKSAGICVDSMQVAANELQFAKLERQKAERQNQSESQFSQCSTSNEGFVRSMLRCDA